MQKWKYPLLGGAAVLLFIVVIASCQPKPKPAPPVVTEPAAPAPAPVPVVPPEAAVEEALPGAMLSEQQQAWLQAHDWSARVGDGVGAWVSVDEQIFRLVQGGRVLWEVPCSTAAKGTGSEANSFKTPLGWHVVKRKTGAGAPWGQVFRSGNATEQIWKPGQSTKEDLVLTRVLFLDGLEPGRNKGGNVDSYARKIYIHGTNDEARIGAPVSHGCVRLRNEDAIIAYDSIPEGTPVLITERG